MLRWFQSKIAIALLGLWAMLSASPVRALEVTYTVSMDTSSIQGQTGFLTMDFLPSVEVIPAQAKVNGFTFDGTFLLETPLQDGEVRGDLNSIGGVIMGNSFAFNSFSQAMTFGSILEFNLTLASTALDNPDPNAPGGTIFALYVLDHVANPDTPPPAFVPGESLFPLSMTNPDGAVLTADVCDCGILTVTPYGPVSVPEPGTASLALVGTSMLIGLAVARRRRNASSGSTSQDEK